MESSLYYILFLFLSTLAAVDIGYRLSQSGNKDSKPGSSVLNGALFALLGLLIAFSFNGASSRFDDRRSLAIDESIAMSLSYSNLVWLQENEQTIVKEKFKEYVRSRIAIYKLVPDNVKAMAAFQQSREVKQELEGLTKNILVNSDDRIIRGLVGGPLSGMFKVEEQRYAALMMHPPEIIFFLLIGITVVVAFLSTVDIEKGAQRPSFNALLFAFVISCVIYIIIDIEYPRDGLIIADQQDYLLEEALERMN
ncbi:MAG: hypothetical protein ACJAYG_002478 [Oceanicoccus sp.]|jgi:hypothetical protein